MHWNLPRGFRVLAAGEAFEHICQRHVCSPLEGLAWDEGVGAEFLRGSGDLGAARFVALRLQSLIGDGLAQPCYVTYVQWDFSGKKWLGDRAEIITRPGIVAVLGREVASEPWDLRTAFIPPEAARARRERRYLLAIRSRYGLLAQRKARGRAGFRTNMHFFGDLWGPTPPDWTEQERD
jgi:hypothetical protein